MAFIIAGDGSEVTLDDQLVEHVVRYAERMAELAASELACLQVQAGTDLHLPAGLALELAALAQLWMWEHDGLADYFRHALPDYASAKAELIARMRDTPKSLQQSEHAVLSQRVLRFWMSRFAWDSQEHLGAEMVCSDLGEAAFVKSLAQVLWDNREHLAKLARNA